MKFNKIIFTPLLSFLLVQCKSPTEQINDAFKTVDKSLDKSNKYLSNSIEDIYYSIDSSRQKNVMLAFKADSVFKATNSAFIFMDSLKQIMRLKDTLGTDIDLATNIFASSTAGDDLKEKLLRVYIYSYSSLIDKTKKARLDTVLNSIGELRVDDNWKKNYFEKTPTVAAITMLSKFQNDCRNAATISLLDIKEHIAK